MDIGSTKGILGSQLVSVVQGSGPVPIALADPESEPTLIPLHSRPSLKLCKDYCGPVFGLSSGNTLAQGGQNQFGYWEFTVNISLQVRVPLCARLEGEIRV